MSSISFALLDFCPLISESRHLASAGPEGGDLGGVAAAGAADDELDGEVELLGGTGGAAVEAREEKLGGLLAGALDGLADDGECGAEDVGEGEVVEADEGDLFGDVDVERGDGVEDVARSKSIGSEDSGGWIGAAKNGAEEVERRGFAGGVEEALGLEAGRAHGFFVAGEARVHGVDLLAETDEADALVAVLDKVLGGESGAGLIFNEDGVDA